MSVADCQRLDVVNILLRRGANAKLLNRVCFNFHLEERDLFITKLTHHTIE
jgi:hypothetical protein